ncbi:hypothetical protein [Hydrogenophaga sp.]
MAVAESAVRCGKAASGQRPQRCACGTGAGLAKCGAGASANRG